MSRALGKRIVRHVHDRQALFPQEILDSDGVDSEVRLKRLELIERGEPIEIHGDAVPFAGTQAKGARRRPIAIIFPVDRAIRDEAIEKPLPDKFARRSGEGHAARALGDYVLGNDGKQVGETHAITIYRRLNPISVAHRVLDGTVLTEEDLDFLLLEPPDKCYATIW